MNQVEWYYARDSKQMGPVSSAELKRLATIDDLRPDDLVWREGMTEWAAARNVRGLFEEEGGEAVLAAGPSAVKVGDLGSKVGKMAGAPLGALAAQPARHPFDALMDKCRSHFNARFVEATAAVFQACGSYGLLVAAVLSATFAVILTARTSGLNHLLWGVIWILILLALQYVAGKALGAIDQLNRTTGGRLSSSVLPDCVVALAAVGGVAALLGSVASAVETSNYMAIVFGVAAFFVCTYLAVIALNWSMLNIAIAPENMAGEEWIGVFMFVLKAILRLTPVAFGAGVICGAFAMGFACYLAFAAEIEPSGATGTFHGPLVTADAILIRSAFLPLIAYLLFLLANLVLNLWHSLLSLPGKLDVLAKNDDEEFERGQPDTVTTRE